MNEMKSFITHLPKVELHVHIEGTLEPELKFKLAERNGMELPHKTVEAMRAAYNFDDLPSFLAIYYEGMSVLQTEADFYDLTMAYLTKAHEQHVLYSEIFFDPQAHTSRGICFDTVINGIHKAQEDAKDKLGIETGLILCFLRDMSAEFAMATLLESLPYKKWIIGVGLDSDEKNNPPSKFTAVMARAKKEGYLVTMHCDVNQEDSTGHIGQCLYDINVDRIDHGVNSLESEALCQEIIDRGLGLTVCPISNQYVVADLKAKEIHTMLKKGMKVTVNSDDPAYFPGYMTENFIAVQEDTQMTRNEVAQLTRNAIDVSWLSAEKKAALHRQLDTYLAG